MGINWEKSLQRGKSSGEKRDFFWRRTCLEYSSFSRSALNRSFGVKKGIFGLWPRINPCPKAGEEGEKIPGVDQSQKNQQQQRDWTAARKGKIRFKWGINSIEIKKKFNLKKKQIQLNKKKNCNLNKKINPISIRNKFSSNKKQIQFEREINWIQEGNKKPSSV